jgi:hypothetical protein
MVSQMYGLGGPYTSHAELSADVHGFLDLTGALTLPRLEEFDLQQDKVKPDVTLRTCIQTPVVVHPVRGNMD